MKKSIVLLIAVAVMAACSSTENGKQAANNSEFISQASPKVKQLWISDEGDFRGVSIGDSSTLALGKETATLKNKFMNMLDYQLDFAAGDWATFQYNFGGDKVIKSINVRYEQMNKNTLIDELSAYLTKRWGEPAAAENGKVWTYKINDAEHSLLLKSSVNAGWERAEILITKK